MTVTSIQICDCGHQCRECKACAHVYADGTFGDYCGPKECKANVADDYNGPWFTELADAEAHNA